MPPKRKDYRPRVHKIRGALSQWRGANRFGDRSSILNGCNFPSLWTKGQKALALSRKSGHSRAIRSIDAQFEKRPSLWIEPLGDWGEGSIDLIELPSPEEINENIVCFWRPRMDSARASATATDTACTGAGTLPSRPRRRQCSKHASARRKPERSLSWSILQTRNFPRAATLPRSWRV